MCEDNNYCRLLNIRNLRRVDFVEVEEPELGPSVNPTVRAHTPPPAQDRNPLRHGVSITFNS